MLCTATWQVEASQGMLRIVGLSATLPKAHLCDSSFSSTLLFNTFITVR